MCVCVAHPHLDAPPLKAYTAVAQPEPSAAYAGRGLSPRPHSPAGSSRGGGGGGSSPSKIPLTSPSQVNVAGSPHHHAVSHSTGVVGALPLLPGLAVAAADPPPTGRSYIDARAMLGSPPLPTASFNVHHNPAFTAQQQYMQAQEQQQYMQAQQQYMNPPEQQLQQQYMQQYMLQPGAILTEEQQQPSYLPSNGDPGQAAAFQRRSYDAGRLSPDQSYALLSPPPQSAGTARLLPPLTPPLSLPSAPMPAVPAFQQHPAGPWAGALPLPMGAMPGMPMQLASMSSAPEPPLPLDLLQQQQQQPSTSLSSLGLNPRSPSASSSHAGLWAPLGASHATAGPSLAPHMSFNSATSSMASRRQSNTLSPLHAAGVAPPPILTSRAPSARYSSMLAGAPAGGGAAPAAARACTGAARGPALPAPLPPPPPTTRQ